MCHRTKGLEDYARSQRTRPDTAVSEMLVGDTACINIILEMLQVY
jgi:hypothetical protein